MLAAYSPAHMPIVTRAARRRIPKHPMYYCQSPTYAQNATPFAPPEPCPFDLLPPEVIGEFMRLYCEESNAINLLLVSQRWKAIALATPALWTRIFFDPRSDTARDRERGDWLKLHMGNESSGYIRCRTTAFCNVLLSRSRRDEFAFATCLDYDNEHWIACASLNGISLRRRCYRLTVHLRSPWQGVPPWFSHLEALRELFVGNTGVSMQPLLTCITLRSPSLLVLAVKGRLLKNEEVLKHGWLLSRIHHLSLHQLAKNTPAEVDDPDEESDSLDRVLMSMGQLRTLELNGAAEWKLPRGDTIHYGTRKQFRVHGGASVKALRITRSYTIGKHLTLSICNTLVDLVMVFPRGNVQSQYARTLHVSLPKLRRLTVEGSWDMVQLLEAPYLDTLTLGQSKDSLDVQQSSLLATSLRPKEIKIHMSITTQTMIKLLRTTWVYVRHLHLVFLQPNDYLRDELAVALAGETFLEEAEFSWMEDEEMSSCSCLRSLSVLAPRPRPERRDAVEKNMQDAMSLVRNRQHSAGNDLIFLLSGWVDWKDDAKSGTRVLAETPEWISHL